MTIQCNIFSKAHCRSLLRSGRMGRKLLLGRRWQGLLCIYQCSMIDLFYRIGAGHGCFTCGHIADKLIITVCLSEAGNVMALNFRVWRSVLSPEAVICYACPQFTLVYKLMNKVYTCSAQASL